MHVLIANIYFAPYSYGGATVVAEQVARHLHNTHGCRISAVSLMNRTDIAPYTVIKVEKDGIQNYLINVADPRSYTEIYDNPKVTEVFEVLLKKLSPDVAHLHSLQEMGAGVIDACRDRQIPVVLSTHDFWWICERQFMIQMNGTYCGQFPVRIEACKGCVDDLGRAKVRFDRLRELGRQVDVLTFPSQFAKDLNEASGFTAETSIVWTNGVQPPGPDFAQRQADRRAKNPRLTFGYVGGPSNIKGWPIIRQAFSGLDRSDFDVLLVDGTLDKSWWADTDLTTLPGHWRIYPRFDQHDMDDFFSQIDVLLFMSQWKETFGLTIREALARGIRVIQTDSGGTTEHPHAQAAHMPKIGDGPERLQTELNRVLDTPRDHPTRFNVTSFANQAAQIHDVFQHLISAR